MKRIEGIDEVRMSNLIKKVSLWFGASLVGIALLERRWVYSHWYDNRSSPNRNPPIVFSDEGDFEQCSKPTQLEDGTQVIPADMKYVISLGFEMDYDATKTSPSPIAYAGTYMHGYRKMIETVASLAEFIRGLGFNALPCANDTALSIPIAIDAGLGEDARHGGLMTPEYGPRARLAKVVTDLPLAADKPITFGVHEFCDQCKKCARWCPGQAIPYGPMTSGLEKNDVEAPTISESVGPSRWIVNHERCRAYWSAVATNCGVCLRVCPWNKPTGALHSAPKWLAINGNRQVKRILIRIDDILGYGRHLTPCEWWSGLPSA
jgi:reductive dehalogenase